MADETTPMTVNAPKRRGRPPGSKNKATSGAGNATATAAPKRRGRPPGSKNKPKGASAPVGKAKKTAGGGGKNMMNLLLGFMRAKPAAKFADAKDAMAIAGHTLYPISWGRAQMLLGRVKVKARGAAKAATNAVAMATNTAADYMASAGAPVKRGRGRPRKNPTAGPVAPTRAASRSGAASIPVASNDLAAIQEFVDALHRGGKAEIRYAGNGWSLSVTQ